MSQFIIHRTYYFILDDYSNNKTDDQLLSELKIKFLPNSIISDSYIKTIKDNNELNIVLLTYFKSSSFPCNILALTIKNKNNSCLSKDDIIKLAKDEIKEISSAKNINETFSYLYGSTNTVDLNEISDDIKTFISQELRGNNGIKNKEYNEQMFYSLFADTKGFVSIYKKEEIKNNNNFNNIKISLGLIIAYQQMIIGVRNKLEKCLKSSDEKIELLKEIYKDTLLFNLEYYSFNPISYDSTLVSECWEMMYEKKNIEKGYKEMAIQMGELIDFLNLEDLERQRAQRIEQAEIDKKNEIKMNGYVHKISTRISCTGIIVSVFIALVQIVISFYENK